MPGPAAQDRKHGRTPNSLTSGEWREYPDVAFTGAPPMPKPPGRRKSWHEMAERMWKTASRMPHCKDWRDEDWWSLEVLMNEIDRYYLSSHDDRTTAQQTEIRRQMIALGIGQAGRKEQKILYKQKVEPGLPGDGPDGAVEVLDDAVPAPAGKVVSLKNRRNAILGKGGGGQADTAAG